MSLGMSTFAELEELNRKTGMGFESKSWNPDTGGVFGPKKEEGDRLNLNNIQALLQEEKKKTKKVSICDHLLDRTHWLVD